VWCEGGVVRRPVGLDVSTKSADLPIAADRVAEIRKLIVAVLDSASLPELRDLYRCLGAFQADALAYYMEKLVTPNRGSRLLTVAEAAGLAGQTKRWIYERSGRLRSTRHPSPGTLRFDESVFREELGILKG
jgi:hypothetical protein